ncbi:LysR family transcriptional regulator [Candidatus Sodalis endolongispinus]|uniref:LysR family transcriptional regulator n=1 Tax=Candidatus Sodalis endolongispinus TaxID=2812662 RepID=A0ABS5Y7Q7_9GAMM|nr:LysR family transcriptional regulator [Candidatus Sodalis endolongispinus]MBT9431023.1 LysR family transcriptional regulator [Candidatus Sodalis endolongispinus]
MDQKSLTSFVVLAEELQFSRAAKRLYVTQSALSQQIARLEKQLWVELFERTKRSVRLSECGHVFLPEAQKVINDMATAAETARRAARGQVGKIAIAYVDAAPFSLLSPLVMHFRKTFPDVELVLHEMTSAEQFDALQDDRIDIGLLLPLYEAEWMRSATLLREPYVVAMHEAHDLAAQPEIHIRALIQEKFLFTSKQKAKYIYSNWDAIFARHGMLPIVVQEVNQLHALLSLVVAGMGMAFLPLSVAQNNNHGVVYRPIGGIDSPSAQLNIAWRDGRNNTLIGHFIHTARQVSARFKGEKESLTAR